MHDPVREYVDDGGYDSSRNAKVTWQHHLQQTTEWEGELWDRKHDFVGTEKFGNGEREPRALQEPGTYYEYNDVRINRLALSLMRVYGKPLPEVLKDEIMDPIGASDSWRYLGYENSWVENNGQQMQSVTGGTRWGGGIWINSYDHARFGLLMLRGGKWRDRALISEEWIAEATTRGDGGPDYGYLWWLNTDGQAWSDAPRTAYRASARLEHGLGRPRARPRRRLAVAPGRGVKRLLQAHHRVDQTGVHGGVHSSSGVLALTPGNCTRSTGLPASGLPPVYLGDSPLGLPLNSASSSASHFRRAAP